MEFEGALEARDGWNPKSFLAGGAGEAGQAQGGFGEAENEEDGSEGEGQFLAEGKGGRGDG